MYTDRKHYQIVIVAVLVMLVLALLINTGALAKNDKPPKDKDKAQPQNGQVTVPHKDKPEKEMRVSCHSRHAREAGITCGEKDKPAATTTDQLAASNVENVHKDKPANNPAKFRANGDPLVFLPLMFNP